MTSERAVSFQTVPPAGSPKGRPGALPGTQGGCALYGARRGGLEDKGGGVGRLRPPLLSVGFRAVFEAIFLRRHGCWPDWRAVLPERQAEVGGGSLFTPPWMAQSTGNCGSRTAKPLCLEAPRVAKLPWDRFTNLRSTTPTGLRQRGEPQTKRPRHAMRCRSSSARVPIGGGPFPPRKRYAPKLWTTLA